MTFSILISEDDPDFQFLFKLAVSQIDPQIDLNVAYTAEQVLDFLLKDDLQRELNRQSLPDAIVADLRPPFFDWDDVKKINSHSLFKHIPIYVLLESLTDPPLQEALVESVAGVFKRPYTFLELTQIMRTILNAKTKPVLDAELFCSRCDDFIERPLMAGRENQFKLSVPEKEFIAARFPETICLACINQLKTSYRIINGDFNVSAGVVL